MSNSEYVFAASSRKLPFLHSKFKPSSKFAKAFSGCNKYSKLKKKVSEDETNVTRLPRITYNAQDSREALPTFGSVHRGTRREYPGFIGNTKIRRHNKNAQSSSKSVPNSIRNESKDSLSSKNECGYLEFLSPRELEKAGSSLLSKRGLDGREVERSDDWTHSQNFATKRRDQRLFSESKPDTETQKQETEEKDMNLKPSELIPEIESLNISDEKIDHTQNNCQNGAHEPKSLKDHEDDSVDMHTSKDQGIRFGENTYVGDGETSESEKAENDPFAKNFEHKLREIRGKSGMKRDRERKRLQRKRGDGEVRPLGDLITSKRLQELFASNTAQGVTIRLHS